MEENKTPWEILKKGTVSIQRGIQGKRGGEKPHMTFWLDKDHDIRLAIWLREDDTANYQITKNNSLIKNTSIDVDPKSNPTIIDYPPDDLPF